MSSPSSASTSTNVAEEVAEQSDQKLVDGGGEVDAVSRNSIHRHTEDTEGARRSRPWAGSQRERDKDNIAAYVAEKPAGVRRVEIVKWLAGVTRSENRRKYERDTKFVAGFVDQPELFDISKKGRSVWVEGMPELHYLVSDVSISRRGMENRTTAATSAQESEEGFQSAASMGVDGSGEDGANGGKKYAKERATALRERYRQFDSWSMKGGFLRELSVEAASIKGRFIENERIRGTDKTGPERMLVSHATRFTSPMRARRHYARLQSALRTSAAEYEYAIALTITSDPKLFNSHTEMTESLVEQCENLRKWLGRRLGPEDDASRPPTVTVREFGEKTGIPHAHMLVLANDRPYVAHEALRGYLADRQGARCYVNEVTKGIDTEGRPEWLVRDVDRRADRGDERSIPASNYFGKESAKLVTLSNMPPSEVQMMAKRLTSGAVDDLTESERGLWTLGLFWSSGIQFWSASPSLKRGGDGGVENADTSEQDLALAPISCYERRRTYPSYDEIPSSIRASSQFEYRPPASASASAPEGAAGVSPSVKSKAGKYPSEDGDAAMDATGDAEGSAAAEGNPSTEIAPASRDEWETWHAPDYEPFVRASELSYGQPKNGGRSAAAGIGFSWRSRRQGRGWSVLRRQGMRADE